MPSSLKRLNDDSHFPIHRWQPESESLRCIWEDSPLFPRSLYVQGSVCALQLLDRLPHDGLAIVGTRNASDRACQWLLKTTDQLKGSFRIIISGFAEGIDAVAHRGALRNGLPTLAVLACGLDIDYPRAHTQLKRDILENGGLLISELPLGGYPKKGHFLRRNRLIAGLSLATLVVEAGSRSGALNTAKWARDYHRISYAVPGFPGDPRCAGNQKLLDDQTATAFWGVHSLGSVWIESATHREGLNQLAHVAQGGGDLKELEQAQKELISTHGYADLGSLFEWAMDRNWDSSRFYLSLSILRQSADRIE